MKSQKEKELLEKRGLLAEIEQIARNNCNRKKLGFAPQNYPEEYAIICMKEHANKIIERLKQTTITGETNYMLGAYAGLQTTIEIIKFGLTKTQQP